MVLGLFEKILDVHINDYDSLKELKNAFADTLDKHYKPGDLNLHDSRADAMKELKRQRTTGLICMQFYWKKTCFEGFEYFQLYELVID